MGCGCGCPGTGKVSMCSARAAALRNGDPHALRLLAASGEIGGLLPEVVLPADVKAYIAKLDPSMVSTNQTVERCASLPSPDAVAWGGFFKSWRKLADDGVHLFASWEAQLNLVKRYEAELEDWQQRIDPICPLSTPIVHATPESFPVLRVVLIGAGVLAVGALGYSFYKTAQQAGKRAKQGREFLESAVDARLRSDGSALARR